MNIKGLLLRAVILASISCVTAHAGTLKVAFSADAPICDGFSKSFSGFDACVTDDDCFLSSTLGDDIGLGLTRVSFEQIAVNQYGYTEVYVGKPPGRSYSLVFLNRFQGDRHPRLLETWKVDALALQSLIAREPHPLPYNEWVKGGHGITRETLAPEFSQLLARSEKVSDDQAPVQMLLFSGSRGDYAVSRECVGEWQFGGEYRCVSVLNVVVKRVDGPKIVPVCALSGFEVLSGLLNRFVPALMHESDKRTKPQKKLIELVPREYRSSGTQYDKLLGATDFVSGMTDSFALTWFRGLSGIELPSS